MDIQCLLTSEQKKQIIVVIERSCYRFKTIQAQTESLFYEPYTEMRQKYSVTSAIISGFAPGRYDIRGISSSTIFYGLNNKLAQPELKCESGYFQIYSNGSDLKGTVIKERCQLYNCNLDTTPVFFLLVVTVSKNGDLKKIEICLPNKDGIIIDRDSIYEHSQLFSVTA